MRKLHFFSILVALLFATTSLWAKPAVADANGKLPGAFSVACGKQVYFSQGNLQYTISTNTWSFMDEQYSRAENGTVVGNNYAKHDVVSHFGWGTSGWNNTENDPTSVHYQPYSTCGSQHSTTDNPYQYGPSNANVIGNTAFASAENWSKEVAGTRPYENYDWGVYNSSNLGAGWRTPTAGEWKYLLEGRTNYSSLRTYATVNSVQGMIILPDDWSLPAGLTMSINTSDFNANNYNDNEWKLLEGAGAVFLPSAGYRDSNGVVGSVGVYSYYWSSSAYDANYAYCLDFYSMGVRASNKNSRYFGFSVRLVQDVPDGSTIIPVADVENPPTAITGLVYNGGWQYLINLGSNAIPSAGTLYYRLLPSEDWVTSWSYTSLRAISAGTYTVQWYIDANGSCYQDSEVKSIEVTIDKATFETNPQQPVTPAASWTYDGNTYDLLTAESYTPSGCTIHYSTDGGETWSTTIPQGHDAGTYTVQYKVVRNSNYYDYIPSTNNPFTVVVSKAPYTPTGDYSVAANALTYIPNTPQQLVSVTGSVTNGTIYYKVGDGDWSTEIPTATTAGAYSVSYKVVPTDHNYEEYVPAASPIAVNIEKANIDLSGVTLPVSPSTIPYEGTPQNLIEIDPIAGCKVWYKLGEGDWTTTPPAETAAANYSVQYKIVPDDSNYNTYGPADVTVTIVNYPTVYDVDVDPTSKLTELLNTTSDLRVKRTIYADDEYNTICLPFALDASALASSQLAGYNRLKAFRGAQVSGSGASTNIDIFVEDATAIEAGVPYLISYPSAHPDIKNPVFEDITVTTTTPGSVSADGVTFKGMFAQVHIDQHSDGDTKDYLFLGANSQLYWPLTSENGDESVKMLGFRAYFIIDRQAIPNNVAPKGTHARFVNAPKQPTSIENTELNTQAQKLLENGQLIILKNGIKYNAQGQVLK